MFTYSPPVLPGIFLNRSNFSMMFLWSMSFLPRTMAILLEHDDNCSVYLVPDHFVDTQSFSESIGDLSSLIVIDHDELSWTIIDQHQSWLIRHQSSLPPGIAALLRTVHWPFPSKHIFCGFKCAAGIKECHTSNGTLAWTWDYGASSGYVNTGDILSNDPQCLK